MGIDREAVILYKRALDRVIAEDLETTEGLPPGEARARAAAMSRPVYSSNQDDAKPSEDPWTDAIRADLRQEVRHRAYEAGLEEVGEVAARVEHYALQHYVKALSCREPVNCGRGVARVGSGSW